MIWKELVLWDILITSCVKIGTICRLMPWMTPFLTPFPSPPPPLLPSSPPPSHFPLWLFSPSSPLPSFPPFFPSLLSLPSFSLLYQVASQELIQAAAEGDITTVTTLLKTGTVHVNVVDRNGHSALFAAAVRSS